MRLKGIIEEDFLNYKEPSMFLLFPECDFKCCKEAGNEICQNLPLVKQPDIEVPVETVVEKYVSNDISRAIVCGGLEPFRTWEDLYALVKALREKTNDMIVIYTGYRNDEIEDKVEILKQFPNIIIKFGRFIPGQEKHRDPVLQVDLASMNQYATRIS